MDAPAQLGRYRVRSVLGRGQMGVVYLAEDPVIGRPVAVKVLRMPTTAEDGESREARARFRREMEVTGTFAHRNIVTVLDVGVDGPDSFIAMEYVEGGSLADLLAEEAPLPFERAVTVLEEIAAALDYAHERGVVHRDVKPANILLTGSGETRVADFGVARLANSTLTRDGASYGSPAYMSPEQAAGQKADAASDQFSLGVIAYEVLTGQRPFGGETVSAVLFQVLRNDPVPPELVNPRLPSAAAEALQRALSKNPCERFASCEEFVSALGDALASRPTSPVETMPLPAAAGTVELSEEEEGRQTAQVASGELSRVAGVLAAVVATTALAVILAAPLIDAGAGRRGSADSGSDAGGEVRSGGSALPAGGGDSGDRPAGDRRSGTVDGSSDATGGAEPPGPAARFPVTAVGSGPVPEKLGERARNAARVLEELAGPEGGEIPGEMWRRARCVAVIPDVVRVGFIVGRRYGRGLASCRTAAGWSRPAFVGLGGGSIGLQIGAQSTDFLLFFVGDGIAEKLGAQELELGTDAATAAGPESKTEAAMTIAGDSQEVYSYSRSRGLFAGISLEGSTLSPDEPAIVDAYGEGSSAADLLAGSRGVLPEELLVFLEALDGRSR